MLLLRAGLRIPPSGISRDGHLHFAFEGRLFSTDRAVVLRPQGGGEVEVDEDRPKPRDLEAGFALRMNNEAATALNRGHPYPLHREDADGAKAQASKLTNGIFRRMRSPASTLCGRT